MTMLPDIDQSAYDQYEQERLQRELEQKQQTFGLQQAIGEKIAGLQSLVGGAASAAGDTIGSVTGQTPAPPPPEAAPAPPPEPAPAPSTPVSIPGPGGVPLPEWHPPAPESAPAQAPAESAPDFAAPVPAAPVDMTPAPAPAPALAPEPLPASGNATPSVSGGQPAGGMQDWITSAMGAAVKSGADLNAFASNLQPYSGDPIGSAMGAALKAGADLSTFGSSLPGLPAAPTSAGTSPTAASAGAVPQVGNVPDWLSQLISANAPPELANDPDFIRTVAAGAKAESGWDPNRVQNGFRMGSGAGARGLFQFDMGGMGAGIPEEQLLGESGAQLQASRIVPLYAKAYASAPAGLSGAEKASWVAGQAERPYQFTDPNSSARRNYASAYNEIGAGGPVDVHAPAPPRQSNGSTVLQTGTPDQIGRIFPLPFRSDNNPDATYHSQGGSDLMAPRGTPVAAMLGGKVVEVFQDKGDHQVGGNAVLIHGTDGLDYYYAHFDAPPSLKIGDTVQAGQQIGAVGNSGNAWKGGEGATHLHIGIGKGISNGVGSEGGLGQDYNAQVLLKSLEQDVPTQQAVGGVQGVLNRLGQAKDTVASFFQPSRTSDTATSDTTSRVEQPQFQVDLPQVDTSGNLTAAATGRLRPGSPGGPPDYTNFGQANAQAAAGQPSGLDQSILDAVTTPHLTGVGDVIKSAADVMSPETRASLAKDLQDKNIPVASGVLSALLSGSSPTDSAQTIVDLNNKYAGTAGSQSIPMKGQAPLTLSVDPSVMTPEDRDAYQKAMIAVGGMENPEMPKGPTPGQLPLGGMGRELPVGNERLPDVGGVELPNRPMPGQVPLGGMGQELVTGGERLSPGVGPDIPGGAQPGQLPLGGMGQELPVGSERLPKGEGEGPRMTGPDVFTPPELKLPGYIPQPVQDLVQTAHTNPFDRTGSLDGPIQRLAKAAGEDPSRVVKAWSDNPDALRALDEAMTQSQSRLGRLQQQLGYDTSNTQAVSEMVGELARYQALQEAVGKRLPKAGSLLEGLSADTMSGQKNLISQVETMAGNAKMTPEEWASQLSKVDLTDPDKLSNFAKIARNYTFTDKLTALWYFNLLSNPLTHIRNIVSNTATAVGTPAESLGAAGFDPLARRLLGDTGPRQRYAGESIAQLQGMKDAIADPGTWRDTLDALKYGTPGKGGEITRLTHEPFAGTPLEALGYPGRALEAEDQFFRGVNGAGALRGEAYRIAKQEGLSGDAFAERVARLTSAPTQEMLDSVGKQAEYRVFQQNDEFASKLNAAWNKWPVLKFVVPFTRTPINVTKYMLERSPLGALKIGADFSTKAGRQALREAGAGDLADRMSRTAMGSALMGGLYAYAASGDNLTGRAPDDPTERDAFYRSGKLPYAFKDPVTGNWHSYQALQPYSTLIGSAADIADAVKRGQLKDPEDIGGVATMAGLAAGKGLLNQTWTQGLYDTLDLFQNGSSGGKDPTKEIERLATQYASNAIPGSALLRGLARMTDNTVRDPNSVLEGVAANLPGVSHTVPERLDNFGFPVERPQSGLDAFLSPFPSSHVRDDPVEIELHRLQDAYGVEPGAPDKNITLLNGKLPVELTDDQQRRYQEQSGQLAYALLTALVDTDSWKKLPDEQKAKEIERIYSKSREVARTMMTPELLGQGLEGYQRQQNRRDAIRIQAATPGQDQEELDALANAG